MKILITGASGMLGATLSDVLSKKYDVYATGNSHYGNAPQNYKVFDLRSDTMDELIEWSNPDVIILCGALTNGNYCDEHPMEALEVNGVSVNKFVKAASKEVKFIYISTDAVFPSKLHLAKEKDCVNPENVYGKSKELGEFFLKTSDKEYCILRTTIVGLNLNLNKSGFVDWIINSAINKEEINLFDDVLFSPISIWELANEIDFLLSLKEFPNKTYHVSGSEAVTKYAFGLALLREMNLPVDKIKKGRIKDFKLRAKRSTDQSLNCSFYQEKYNRTLPKLEDTVKLINQYYNEWN